MSCKRRRQKETKILKLDMSSDLTTLKSTHFIPGCHISCNCDIPTLEIEIIIVMMSLMLPGAVCN